MDNIASLILAMAPQGEGGGDIFGSMIPIIAVLAVIYFLMIRPEQTRKKEHKSFVDNLKRGDNILTQGGIVGRVSGVTETIITVEIAPKVHVKFHRAHISGAAPDDSAQSVQSESDDSESKNPKKKKK